uniref:ZP domain-containing protein n=1 Tax=Loxodonta africana TaxID=9785 RepID=G3TYK1_LOXAF
LRCGGQGGLIASLSFASTHADTDFTALECVGSLMRMTLKADHTLLLLKTTNNTEKGRKIDEALAAQCGYTIFSDHWENVELWASLLSCYTQIQLNRISFTVVTLIFGIYTRITKVHTENKSAALIRRKILCEANYMEVSVKTEVPLMSMDLLQDEPEDWAAAFPEATSGVASIWQIVFHTPTLQHVMLVSDAYRAGYGINTTDTRILLRAGFTAPEVQELKIQGITFSAVRSSTFYKQRWMILMVDTAVACPVDDVDYSEDTITWSILKNISPLFGASHFKDLSIQMGVSLHKLSTADIVSRNYGFRNDSDAIVIEVPVGTEGGYYKKHQDKYRIRRRIKVLSQIIIQVKDEKVTKHTMIKAVTTPLYFQEPIIINNTNTSLRLFSITVESFLPDVELVNFTVKDKVFPVPVPEASDYSVNKTMLGNGSNIYNIEVSFDVPSIEVESLRTSKSLITILPSVYRSRYQDVHSEHYLELQSRLKDAVLPKAGGHCDADHLSLTITRGNVDRAGSHSFLPCACLTPESAKKYGYWFQDNGTHLALQVPRFSAHITYEDISPSRISASLQLHLNNNQTLSDMKDFSITCPFSSEGLIDLFECLPDCKSNGSMIITAMKLEGVPGLGDTRCQPAVVTKTSATFVFSVNTCRTSRKFEDHILTYESDVLYFRPGATDPVYQLRCACRYPLNGTDTFHYQPKKNPAPSVEPGLGHLALSMKVSKDALSSEFYKDMEYPVVKYLRDPVFFEIDVLYSEDPQLELFLEGWSTLDPDPKNNPQWDIIINSCANVDNSHETVFHPVDVTSVKFPSHVKRFEVKMFTFMKEDRRWSKKPLRLQFRQLYFHCSMVICNSKEPMSDLLCTKKCIPGKQRLSKSLQPHSTITRLGESDLIQISLFPEKLQ